MIAMFHPFTDDEGQPVLIKAPSTPTAPATWTDPDAVAIFVPGGAVPAALNGIAIAPWSPPGTWEALAGAMTLVEPPFTCPMGLKPAAGAVVIEPDGRIWCVAPTNRFGGHEFTFPKGRTAGSTLAVTALTEAWEETGLTVELTGWLCDVDRSVTRTRFYLARRVGGSPVSMGWESQACLVAPVTALREMLTHPGDQLVLEALERLQAQCPRFQRGATIKSDGGVLVRCIEAINGYRSKFGEWPTGMVSDPETLVVLATAHLTPLGFYLMQMKLDFLTGVEGVLLATGAAGTFDYGTEGWQTDGEHAHSARNWLGFE